jgi:hypothetical protein
VVESLQARLQEKMKYRSSIPAFNPGSCSGLAAVPYQYPTPKASMAGFGCIKPAKYHTCINCGDGNCLKGENGCTCPRDCKGGACLGEGERNDLGDTSFVCCKGLAKKVYMTYIPATNYCSRYDCPCFICVYCPDKKCGPGEDKCICPEDCP